MSTLIISPDLFDRMVSSVEFCTEECCGFLLGVDGSQERTVYDMIQVPNVSADDKRRTFEVSALSYMEAEDAAEEKGLQLIGVYHSHPGSPAIPSSYDLMAAQPFFSYVILSVYNGKTAAVRSWRLGADRHFEEEILSIFELIDTFHGYSDHPNTSA